MIDLMLLGREPPPRKLARAFDTIAKDLHLAFETLDWIEPGISRESCVLCSLAVRDFLRMIGFASANVAPVMMTIRAFDAAGNQVHSLGLGLRETPDKHARPTKLRHV